MGFPLQLQQGLRHRFLAKVNKLGRFMPGMKTRCHEWTGYVAKNGYGQIGGPGGRSGKVLYAHRVSYALIKRLDPLQLPTEVDVCHKCDNRACVRYSHLFKGTRLDNMRDAVAKGRTARGARHGLRRNPHAAGSSRLSPADVVTIRSARKRGEKLLPLAAQFGVTISAISMVALGRVYKMQGST